MNSFDLRGKKLLIACSFALVCFVGAATPQSVETKKPGDPDSASRPAKGIAPGKVLSLIVAGELVSESRQGDDRADRNEAMPTLTTGGFTTDLESALKECVRKIKKRPQMSAGIGGKMARIEARHRAKAESASHVLWLSFVYEKNQSGDSPILYVDYALFAPQTAAELTFGRIIPDRSGVITHDRVLVGRRITGPATERLQMKESAREVVDSLIREGWF